MHAQDRKLNFLGFRPTGDFANLTAYTSNRNKVVWFEKSPPLEPASPLQQRQRDRYRLAAQGWQQLPQEDRNAWLTASRRCRLHVSGYALWLWFQIKRDRPTIQTIERLSGQSLLPN